MPRLLLVLILTFASAAQAAQSIAPGVYRALQEAQSAQQRGDYGAARKALRGAGAKPGSIEQALVWRSLGYLAWAQGDTADAVRWLDKALVSGKLDEQTLAAERANLARLYLAEGDFARVVSLLKGADQQDADILRMLVQAYQGLGQHAKALPLAERYVAANPRAEDVWLQLLVAGNAELKRYPAAERWQRQLLLRHPDQPRSWRQLAGLQQLAGADERALATLRTAYAKGLRFSEAELDNLVLLAAAAGQPWQAARLLDGMLDAGLLQGSAARRERLAQLWWQARERSTAAELYRELAARSGQAKLWMNLAQLELEQAHWQAGLEALRKAERAGAERRQVRAWREWAESELSFERERQVARTN